MATKPPDGLFIGHQVMPPAIGMSSTDRTSIRAVEIAGHGEVPA